MEILKREVTNGKEITIKKETEANSILLTHSDKGFH